MAKWCFVISAIGEKESEERRHADDLLKYLIAPSATEAGYERTVRADQIEETGIISAQIVRAIHDADLVIADLSFPNPNVYYELAIRHALRTPLVQIARTGTKLPFDISPVRTLFFDLSLRGVDEAKKDLKNRIIATEDGGETINNPIAQVIESNILEKSDMSGAEILSKIYDMQYMLLRYQNIISKKIDALEPPSRKKLGELLLGGEEAAAGTSPFATTTGGPFSGLGILSSALPLTSVWPPEEIPSSDQGPSAEAVKPAQKRKPTTRRSKKGD